MIRLSSTPGSLTLVVGLGDGRAYHHRIGRNDEGKFVVRLPKRRESGRGEKRHEEAEERAFDSLWAALHCAIEAFNLVKSAPATSGVCHQRRGIRGLNSTMKSVLELTYLNPKGETLSSSVHTARASLHGSQVHINIWGELVFQPVSKDHT